MWIRLKAKIPTGITPPAMSIHWAGAKAEVEARVLQQKQDSGDDGWKQLNDCGDMFHEEYSPFEGYETKEEGSVWILFDGEALKVFPHEYNRVEDINEFLKGNGASNVPMYGRDSLYCDPITLKISIKFDKYPRFNRDTYEAALIDGLSENDAFYEAIQKGEESGLPKDLWFAFISIYGDYLGLTKEELTPKWGDSEVFDKIKAGWED